MKNMELNDDDRLMLRTLAQNILAMKEDERKLAEGIRHYAVDVDFDVFGPLISDENVIVRESGFFLLQRAVQRAKETIVSTAECALGYIDESDEYDSDERKELFAAIDVDKVRYKEQTGKDFDSLKDTQSSEWHILRVVSLFETVTQEVIVKRMAEDVDVLNTDSGDIKINPEDGSEEIETQKLLRGFHRRPDMIGAFFAHFKILELVINQNGARQNINRAQIDEHIKTLFHTIKTVLCNSTGHERPNIEEVPQRSGNACGLTLAGPPPGTRLN